MRELRDRMRNVVARVRAGEGAVVLADLGETLELWIKSTRLPLPNRIRTPLEQLGEVLGDFARAHRPAPDDVPPPPEAPGAVAPLEEERPARPSESSRQREVEPGTSGSSNGDARIASSGRNGAPRGSTKTNGGARASAKSSAVASSKPNGGQVEARAERETKLSRAGTSKSAAKGEGKSRVSARRSKTAKKASAKGSAQRASDPPTPKKSNGKGRARRPAARRARHDKTDKPT